VGMLVIVVPRPDFPPTDDSLDLADVELPSLTELPVTLDR